MLSSKARNLSAEESGVKGLRGVTSAALLEE